MRLAEVSLSWARDWTEDGGHAVIAGGLMRPLFLTQPLRSEITFIITVLALFYTSCAHLVVA